MSNLSTKIKIYAANNGVSEVDFLKDVLLQNDSDGKGDYIKEWNLDIAQPTDEQLAAVENDANTKEANDAVDAARREDFKSWQHQLDEIYHDIDAWRARLAQVKADNPKQ